MRGWRLHGIKSNDRFGINTISFSVCWWWLSDSRLDNDWITANGEGFYPFCYCYCHRVPLMCLKKWHLFSPIFKYNYYRWIPSLCLRFAFALKVETRCVYDGMNYPTFTPNQLSDEINPNRSIGRLFNYSCLI